MKKEYIIFNQRLAGFLMMNGFVLKRMDRTRHTDSNRNILYSMIRSNYIKQYNYSNRNNLIINFRLHVFMRSFIMPKGFGN
jgi:hypothetical protein